MIPSINAMIRSTNQLSICADESLLLAKQLEAFFDKERAKQYFAQAHDFAQVIQYLKEQVELRQPKKGKKNAR